MRELSLLSVVGRGRVCNPEVGRETPLLSCCLVRARPWNSGRGVSGNSPSVFLCVRNSSALGKEEKEETAFPLGDFSV